jgi:hypothetical protein
VGAKEEEAEAQAEAPAAAPPGLHRWGSGTEAHNTWGGAAASNGSGAPPDAAQQQQQHGGWPGHGGPYGWGAPLPGGGFYGGPFGGPQLYGHQPYGPPLQLPVVGGSVAIPQRYEAHVLQHRQCPVETSADLIFDWQYSRPGVPVALVQAPGGPAAGLRLMGLPAGEQGRQLQLEDLFQAPSGRLVLYLRLLPPQQAQQARHAPGAVSDVAAGALDQAGGGKGLKRADGAPDAGLDAKRARRDQRAAAAPVHHVHPHPLMPPPAHAYAHHGYGFGGLPLPHGYGAPYASMMLEPVLASRAGLSTRMNNSTFYMPQLVALALLQVGGCASGGRLPPGAVAWPRCPAPRPCPMRRPAPTPAAPCRRARRRAAPRTSPSPWPAPPTCSSRVGGRRRGAQACCGWLPAAARRPGGPASRHSPPNPPVLPAPAGALAHPATEVKVARYTHGRSTNYKVLGLAALLGKGSDAVLQRYDVLHGRRLRMFLEPGEDD